MLSATARLPLSSALSLSRRTSLSASHRELEHDQEPATDLHPDAGDSPGRAAVRRARSCATRLGNDRDRGGWC